MGNVSSTIRVVDRASSVLNKIYNSISKVDKAFAELGNTKTVTDSFSKAAININSSLDSVDKKINAVKRTMTTMPSGVKPGLDGVEKEVKDIGEAAKKSANHTNLLISKLRRLASTYLGVMGAQALIGASDTLTSANNKLVTYGTQNFGLDIASAESFSADTMDKIYNSAKASYSSYSGMINNVAKSLTVAGDAFGDSQEQQVNNAIKFQEIMAKNYALGGASAAEQASSMYQLVQALGSGTLAGDELRSVREGAPLAAKAIEKFAQQVHGTTKSLKEMGSEGLITSDMVVAAILNMQGETEKAFEYIQDHMTFGMIWENFKTDALYAFKPALKTLEQLANSDGFKRILNVVTNAISVIGDALSVIFGAIGSVLDWMDKNWDIVEPILNALFAILIAIASVAVVRLIQKIGLAITKFLALNATQVATIGIISVLIWYFSQFGLTCDTLGQALFALGVAGLVAGLMVGNIWFIVGAVILMVLGIFLMFTEQFMAGVYAMAAVLYNVVGAAWELILGFLEIVWNAYAAFANFLGNLFNDPIAAVVGLFIDMADVVLGVLETIASGIDFIFGSNLSGTISGWRSSMKGWYDTTFTPEVFVEDFDKSQFQMDRWSYSDAISQGAEVGAGIRDSIDGALSNLTSGLDGLFNGNTVDLGVDTGNLAGVDLSGFDLLGDAADSAGKTAKNTGDMAKSMELTEEDLKYLRQIAEMEAINKFTTAEIKVEMTNNNTMNNMGDLDGIVTHLSTVLKEELNVVARGVHYA